MAALSVALNGGQLVCVATDGFDVVDVGVSGDLLGPDPGTLRISGGSFREGRPSRYLIWEDARILAPGDVVSVAFLSGGSTSRPGKTIEELYPDEKRPDHPFTPPDREEVVRQLKQRPKAFRSLAFQFTGPDGESVRAETAPEDHAFAFSVIWNFVRAEHARFSVHTYTLDSLITKESGKYHADSKLAVGQNVAFKILGGL